MPKLPVRLVGIVVLGSGLALFVASCSNQQPQQELVFGQTVRGTVTYEGEPVPWGYVLFYSHEKSLNVKKGTFTPVAVGEIKDGKYEMLNVPAGPAIVCVATDPNTDPAALMRPAGIMAVAPPKGLPGEPPPAPPHGPPVGLPEGPPVAPPAGAPPGGPPGPLPPGPPGGLPGGFPGAPPVALNPLVEKLTPAQKDMLKAIHAKYGVFGKSSLSYEVKEGEQTFDIVLQK